MVTEFILQNMTSQNKVKFGMDIDCDFVYPGEEGVDWGSVPVDHNTYSYPDQVGDSISNSKIKNRDVTITGYAYYILTEDERSIYTRDEWKEYAYNKIKEKKKVLNDLVNPQDYLRMIIGDYYIEGKPSSSPIYGVNEVENNVYFCRFMISIFCANPMFHKNTETKTVLTGDVGAFHFPFILEPTGYIMGTRINYLILIVENEGNAKIGGKIILESKGIVQNPIVENIYTGEKMKINKTLMPNETVIINTTDGATRGVTGIYNGVESDYLMYWDFENDWIKFDPGSTVIGYSTENQSEASLNVSVEINPEKFGLEEM